MSSSLTDRVHHVQSAASRLRWLYGWSRFAIVAVVGLAAIVVVDYWLRWHDPLVRWLASAVGMGLLVWAFVRLTARNLISRENLLTTARRIEQRYPELGERLTSAVAFLSQPEDDFKAGSRELRRAVVAETEALADGLDFHAALSGRAARRAGIAAAATIVLAGLFAAFNLAPAGLAMARLVQPWRELPWPRRHELAFVNPPRVVARGDDFELELVDRRGLLPDDLEFMVRHQTPTGWETEVRPLNSQGERVLIQQGGVSRGFEYRARGGDDDTMPWTAVAVVDRPKITELQIVVEPPAYTGLAQRSEGRIVTALIGSRLRVSGSVDQPIRAATLKAQTTDFSLPAAHVSADGRRFVAPSEEFPWLIQRSGVLSLELTDDHGLVSKAAAIELHAAPDLAPTIDWILPADHSFVTSRARIPIRAVVRDDLAIRGVQLRYLREDKGGEQVLELASGQDEDAWNIDQAWDLSRLEGLVPGDSIAIRLTAEDHKPQLAATAARRLTIVTPEELVQRLAKRQAAVLSQLADALRLARQSREQRQTLETRLRTAEQVTAADINQLQTARHNQQQVQRLLAANSDGALGQIAALVNELVANQADQQVAGQQLWELWRQLQPINEDLLPAIERALAEATELATAASTANCVDTPVAQIAERLRAAGAREDAVIAALEKMVGTLTELDDLNRIGVEVGQVRAEQERVAGETDALRLKAIVAIDNASADRAIARQLSERQFELARRMDKLQNRMETMRQQLAADDPRATDTLAGALEAARELSIGTRMREAAARLAQHQLGQAWQSEQDVLNQLEQLMRALLPRSDENASNSAGRSESGIGRNTEQGRGTVRPGTGTGDVAVGPARESANRIERGGTGASARADAKEVIRRAWGHLPDQVREQMQSSLSEQFLPQYERLIEEYYKRLAEDRPAVP